MHSLLNIRTAPAALAFVLLILAMPVQRAEAQRAPGAVGIGFQFGDPTGVSLNFYRARPISWDVLAGWDTNDFVLGNIHAMYEHHFTGHPDVHLQFGPGVYAGLHNGDRVDDRFESGISGMAGIGFLVQRVEIYGRVIPRLAIVPDTQTHVGAGVGLRYYFF